MVWAGAALCASLPVHTCGDSLPAIRAILRLASHLPAHQSPPHAAPPPHPTLPTSTPQLVNRTSAEERPRFVSLADHCRHKLLLHLAGNTYAARLKYLLACGAAVVAPESVWSEFWHHLLRPGEHFIAVEEGEAALG